MASEGAVEDRLADCARAIQEKCVKLEVTAESHHQVMVVYLAYIFNLHVSHSGFGGLFKAAQGNYLEDIENMLIELGAVRAQRFYTDAVKEVLADRDGYDALLAGHRAPLEDRLKLLSLDYLRKDPRFVDEAAAELSTKMEAAWKWASSSI